MNNVVQFQRMHPLHREFAPGVIEHHKAPLPLLDRILLKVMFAAVIVAVVFLFVAAFRSVDWSALALLPWKS